MADSDLNRKVPGEGGNIFSTPGKMQRAWFGDVPPVLHPGFRPAQMGTPSVARITPGSVGTRLLAVLGLRDALPGCMEGLSLESGFL